MHAQVHFVRFCKENCTKWYDDIANYKLFILNVHSAEFHPQSLVEVKITLCRQMLLFIQKKLFESSERGED